MILKIITNPYIRGLTIVSAILSISLFIYNIFDANNVDLRIILEEKKNLIDNSLFEDKLKIFYDDIDLTSSKKLLFSYKFKVVNIGKKEIGINHFDTIGLKISNNKFLSKPHLDHNTSEYYLRKINLVTTGDSLIQFPSAIFNANDYFYFSFISNKDLDDKIDFMPIGTIKEQGAFRYDINRINQDIIYNFFKEPISTHLLRLCLYLSVILSLLGLVNIGLFLTSKISLYRQKSNRNHEVVSFKNIENYSYTKLDEVVFKRYVKEGSERLKIFDKQLSKFDKLKFHIKKYSLTEGYLKQSHDREELASLSLEKKKYLKILKEMQEDGYVYFDKRDIVKNNRLITVMQEFLRQTDKTKS